MTKLAHIAFVVVVLVSAPAAADPARLALWLDGKTALRLRPALLPALARYTLVSQRLVRHATERLRGRHDAAALARLRGALHADAVLVARVVTGPDGDALTLDWLAGEGDATRRVRIPLGRRGHAAVAADLGRAVATLSGQPTAAVPPAAAAPPAAATPPSAATPPPAATRPPAATPPPAPSMPADAPPVSQLPPVSAAAVTPPATAGASSREERTTLELARRASAPPRMVDVAAGVSLGGRTLSYTDVLTTNLRTFVAGAVPLAVLGLELYPAARARVRGLADVGVLGHYAHSLYGSARFAATGDSFATAWSAFDAGLTGRLRLGEGRPTIAVSLVYGGLDFAFNAGGQLLADMPSVSYRYLRPALSLRVPLGRVTLSAESGFLGVLSAGYFRGQFPRSRVEGVDVALGVTVAIASGLQARLGGRYSRFFYDLRPTPGDAAVAGGALDEYATGELSLAWSM